LGLRFAAGRFAGADLRTLAVLRVDLVAGFFAPAFFGAVFRAVAEAFRTVGFFADRLGFVFLAGLPRIAFRALVANDDTASVTAVPAVTVTSFVASIPAAAASNPALAVSAMASFAVAMTPSFSFSTMVPLRR
jgi:hypothetical protein